MSAVHHFIRADDSIVEVCTTDVDDGDFHVDAESVGLRRRRAAVMPGEWAVARQVHGARVVEADPARIPEADAIITSAVGQPIAVQGADCAPIAFITDRGPIAVAHAGWRGLAEGIVACVVGELSALGCRVERAIVGPVIGPECYEFGLVELEQVVATLGEDVRSRTTSGAPALDLRAGITAAFADVDVLDVQFVSGCTACEGSGFSHRARGDVQRHALAARILSTVSAA